MTLNTGFRPFETPSAQAVEDEEVATDAAMVSNPQQVKQEAKAVEETPPQDPLLQNRQDIEPEEPSFRPFSMQQPNQAPEPEGKGYSNAFKRGLQHSAAGELIEGKMEIPPDADQNFWGHVIENSGSLVGDAPFMAIGGMIGAAGGAVAGSVVPIVGTTSGAIVGGGFGAMAFPEFIKESMREYKAFQDRGGDLTFGEFIQSADRIAGKTLKAGAFGAVMSQFNKALPYIRKIPAIDNLLNTKYIGKPIETLYNLSGETAVGTVVPAAAEMRLPTSEDLASAAVLFAGQKAAYKGFSLPGQMADIIRQNKSASLNYALADRISDLNLSYPPLDEFKTGTNPIYKNDAELNKNLAAFDLSYVNNIVSMINALSPTDFMSAHEAGTSMQKGLAEVSVIPEPVPEATPTAQAPVKPTRKVIPLARNPVAEGADAISPRAATLSQVGDRITQSYHKNREAERVPLEQRYTDFEEIVEGMEAYVGDEYGDQAQALMDDVGISLIPTKDEPPFYAILRRAANLGRQFDAEGNQTGNTEVSINELIRTNRSLKKIPSWEVPPTMTNLITRLTDAYDVMIAEYIGNFSEETATEYLDLRNDYAAFKNRYDRPMMKKMWNRSENAESVAKAFMRRDDFVQLTDALSGSPEGTEALNFLRREVWEDTFTDKAMTARTEQDFDAAMQPLQKKGARKFQQVMEYLTPEQRNLVSNVMQETNRARASMQQVEAEYGADMEKYNQEKAKWKEETKKNKKPIEDVNNKQNLLVSLMQENPAKVAANMDTIEGIRRVKEASKQLTNGNELYDALARFETDNMFQFMRDGYIRTGRMPYTQMKIQMENKEFRAKLKELNGEGFVKKMDELVEVSDKLSKNFKEAEIKFKDDPTVVNTILQIYSVMALAQGNILTPLLAFSAKKNMLKLGNKTWNMWMSRYNLDPEYVKKAIDAGRAVLKGDRKDILKKGSLLNPPFALPEQQYPSFNQNQKTAPVGLEPTT